MRSWKSIMLAGAGLLAAFPVWASETTIRIATYGGVFQEAQVKALFDPYMHANPDIKLVIDSSASNAKIKAMVEAGAVTWDLVIVDDSFGLEAHAQWLEPIDYAVVDKEKFIDGMAQKYRLVQSVEGTVLAYNTKTVGEAGPKGIGDYFDLEKFPGYRTAWKFAASGLLEAALVADGVKPEELYPLDVDRALKKLDTIKEQIVWWESGAQSEQLLISGEADIGLLWIGRAAAHAESGIAIDWTDWTPQNAWWVVPKGAENREAAMKAIEFFTSAAPQVAFTEFMPYGPSNASAVNDVKPNFKGNMPTEHLETQIPMDMDWWAEHQDEVNLKFQKWLLE
ncbi:ABC transporter substrate-binding protein [Shinella daejeonensis]|uniref:ABC transporter substrate-binding protein n=1 Tax=Shinella daejeonensis TaxID=659017 RepID=UPI0020C7E198|nr:ABC transporter substrate-binding protein [Shinella daejeonensis]MCP8894731.1 ABC transporter substrate-binding protein [Shinella daejeonensis]